MRRESLLYFIVFLIPVTSQQSPSKVQGVTVTRTVQGSSPALRVSWSAVSGSGITYTVCYSAKLGNRWSYANCDTIGINGTSTTLGPLSGGTAYLIWVRAVSSGGQGPQSDYVEERTCDVPSRPTLLDVLYTLYLPFDVGISVSWRAPQSDCEITSYEVQYKNHSTTSWSTPAVKISQAKRHNWRGLSPNTSYDVRVRAVSAAGKGAWSDVGQVTTPEVPGPVRSLSATPIAVNGVPALRIRWSPPVDKAGGGLTYRLRVVPSHVTIMRPTRATVYIVGGLRANTRYGVYVSAGSSGHYGPEVFVVTSTLGSPGPVQSLSTTPIAVNGLPALHVRWSPPEDKAQGGLTYRLRVVPPHVTISRAVTTAKYKVTGLRAYTRYTVHVRAVSSGVYGPEESAVGTSGGSPTDLILSPLSSTTVLCSWTPPVNHRKTPLMYAVSHGQPGAVSTAETSLTLTELQPYKEYTISVKAQNRRGSSVPVTGTVRTYSDNQTNIVNGITIKRALNNSVLVTWIPVETSSDDSRGSPLYIVTYTPSDGGRTGSMNTTSNSVTLTGLDSGVSYVIAVQVTFGKVMNKEDSTPGPNPVGAIVGVLLAISLIGTVTVVAVIVFLCIKKKKTPVCLSGGMTKVQGVRHSLKRKQKDEDYEMQPQPEVVYYQSLTVGSLEPIPQSSFSVHVKAMHMERDSGFEREYQTIVNDPNGSAEIAMENRTKNRYFNIHTYDHSRVVLNAPDENGSAYINASYIDGYEKKDAYIASQGPKVDTISDFWEMVWEQKSHVIVMLTKVEEKGKIKCEQYWCEELDKPYELKRNLTVTTRFHRATADCEIRDIRVMKHDDQQSKPLEVVHMQYTGWPDHGVPTHPSSLVKFVQQVRKEYKDSTAPMVVHCSAGVGRTGTFITIDAMMERLKEKDDLNIYQFVTEMRNRRTFMVQTMDQYAFIHDALCDYLTCGDTTIPAHQLTAKIIEMSAVKEETNTTEFQDQFEFLENLSKNTCAEDYAYSKKTIIAKKNRYKDKFPYSNCHLKLHSRNSSNGGDYINASFIDSFSRSKGFIAAQAPLENTKNDVWQLIWQFKIPTVVVLCGFNEEQQTCIFWPNEITKSMEFDHIKVNHDSTISKTGYEMTRLDAFEEGMDTKQVSVTLFHVNNWSKSGSVDLNSVLKLMGDVEGAHTKMNKPIMVMCDDGMGRSGVFICAMSEVERVKVEGQVDVFQTIKGMRIQRPHMVDTPEHYKLCFDILLTHLDSFDTYANFKAV